MCVPGYWKEQRQWPNDRTSGKQCSCLALKTWRLAASGTLLEGTIHVGQRRQHYQECGHALVTGNVRPGPPPPPLFQWYVFHSNYSAFSQIRFVAGQLDPSGD